MPLTLDTVKARYPGAESFAFGDSAELSEELIALVRSGKKTGTCGALRDFSDGQEVMPVVGRKNIALDWDGKPALVTETLSVVICRFRDVDAEFALSEGENDDLAGWRRDHQAFFERNGGFSPEMELVCEQLRLVEDLAGEAK
ncbi:ASCH domain-containing protein [Roseibium sp.]|uniref:ASCH domain-containing protein n=1 Tax=Roseibium sp. TaxID=1936156 RepID=UPI003A96BEA5